MKNFVKLLSEAAKFTAGKKAIIPELQYVRVCVSGGLLTIASTNLEQFYVRTEQTILPECDFLIHKDMIKALKSVKSELQSIGYDSASDECHASLYFQDSSFKIDSPHINGFPRAPQLPTMDLYSQFNISDSLNHMYQASKFCALDSAKTVLTGVSLSELGIRSTDGYRLFEYNESFHNTEVIIPAKSIDLAFKQFKKSQELKLAITGSHACFFNENVKVWTRLIEGKFPRTERIKPKHSEFKASLNTQELKTKLKSLPVNNKTQAFTMNDNQIKSELGSSVLNMNCPIQISFNKAYFETLLNTLIDLNIDKFDLNLNSETSPAFINHNHMLFMMVIPIKP